MQYRYTIHKTEQGYDGFLKVNRHWVTYEKFKGGYVEKVIRECGRKTDVVGVLAYDPVRQEFLMVEQFRIGMTVRDEHAWTMEIVAGFMDVTGESPLETARRELYEETGCEAKTIRPLLEYYPSPGSSGSKVYLFVAEVDATDASLYTGIIEEGEDIRVHRIAFDEVYQQTLQGTIGTSTATIAFQQFFLNNWSQRF